MKTHLERILTSGALTLGEYTKQFEDLFAANVKVKHAVATNSGTSALEIAIKTQKLRERDEVVVPTNTFGATAAAIIYAGAHPMIADINSKTLTLDAETLDKAITEKTKGVVAVHIGGLVCPEIEEIREICDDRGLFLIEDAAHAHGSQINGRSAGSFGSAGCFSFYPTKVITSGEGGMITTNDEGVANIAKTLRDQGKENYSSNRIVMVGYNWRIPEISAALGLLQLRRLPEFIANRNRIAKIYDDYLEGMDLERVVTPANELNNYYKYTFFLPKGVDREQFKSVSRQSGVVYGGEVYWPPLHLQPAYREFLAEGARFEVAEDRCRHMVNPPIFSQMTSEQAQRVIEVTRKSLPHLEGASGS